MRKHLKFFILLLLAVLILWWFGRNLDWAEVRRSVAASDWRLLIAALFAVSVTYLIRALRWRVLLKPLAPAGMRELFAATTVGFGAVFLAGRAGEIVRPVVLPVLERRVRPVASFVTIAVERICDAVAIVVMFSLNLLWLPAPAGHGAEFRNVRLAGLILLAGAILGLATLAWFRRRSNGVIKWLDRKLTHSRFVPARLGHALVSLLEQLARALRVLVNTRELIAVTFWSTVLWLIITLANWLVLLAFGLPFGFKETIFVLGWGIVGSLVPTPGGAAGAFHAVTAAGMMFLGVAREQAAAASIVIHLVDFAPALLFGLYFVLRGDVTISRLRELSSSEAVEHAVEDEELEIAEETGEAARAKLGDEREEGLNRRVYG